MAHPTALTANALAASNRRARMTTHCNGHSTQISRCQQQTLSGEANRQWEWTKGIWSLQLRGLLTWRQVNTGMEQLECVELNTPGSTESVIINFYQLSWYAYWWNSCAFNAVIQQSGDTFIHHQQTDGIPSFRFFQPLSYTAKLQTVTVEATVMCWHRLTWWIPDRHLSMETTCSVHCVC